MACISHLLALDTKNAYSAKMIITPSHYNILELKTDPYFLLKKKMLCRCVFWPWTECFFLQTPKDKVKCVFRCATTIMNLLSMANEKAVPAADDFIPVIIFVIIKANPPCLLSTIQYIQSFYGNRIGGEEQYWWIQFCSAVEFIKNMDYNEWPRSIISL